ncbi:hypothetical protein H8E52_00125 [bacterium]|nr:hypothetical protein [bacterium]
MKGLGIILLLSVALTAPALELDITINFAGRPIQDVDARGDTEYMNPDSLLLMGGLKASWAEGEIFDVRDMPVIWDKKRNHLRFRMESDSLLVYLGEESGLPQRGKFKLDQPFRLVGPGILVKLDQGRYFFEGNELKLFLPGSAWKRGARGFMMAAFVGVITLILLLNGRKTRRRIEEERGPTRKPRRP